MSDSASEATSLESSPDDASFALAAPSLPFEERDGAVSIAVTGEQRAALVRDPLARTIWRVAVPAVASNLLMTVFLAADAYWVGTRIGSYALAAVTASVFWVWLGVSVAEMVSVGLTAVAARRHGQGRREDAARTAGDAILLAVALGVIVAVLGHLFLDEMFSAMTTPPDIAALGARYLGTYLLAAPLIFGYFAVDAAFRASGNTRTPFLILLVSVSASLALDPVLILGRLGVPAMGIAGAAVATVASRSVAFVVGIVLLRRRGMLRFGKPHWATLRSILRVGLPTGATGVLFSAIYVLVGRTTAQFGMPALAALGLGFRVESWLYMLGIGFGAAAAAIVGQNLGAGQIERAERTGWLTLGYASIPAVVVFLLELLVPERIASVFTHDAAVIAETARYLRIASLAQLLIAAELVLDGALGGAGETVPPMITSTILTASRVPLAAWAAMHWGTTGIWWVINITAIGRALAMMAIWRSGRWKRRSV